MVWNVCSTSHGQPVIGVRSAAMISIRREMSREGVIAGPDRAILAPCMPQRRFGSQQKRAAPRTGWPAGAMVLSGRMNDDQNMTALVLFSGGQDSTTCLAWALDRFARVETIGFAYGQRHAIELDCRERLLDGLTRVRPDWAARLGDSHTLDIP